MGCCSAAPATFEQKEFEIPDNVVDSGGIIDADSGLPVDIKMTLPDNGNSKDSPLNALKSGMDKWLHDGSIAMANTTTDILMKRAEITCVGFNKNIEEFIQNYANSNQYSGS